MLMILTHRRQLPSIIQRHAIKSYSSTAPLSLEEDVTNPTKATKHKISMSYNSRRAAYKKAVGKLRKEYAEEVERQRIADETERAQKQAADTYRRLKRQRLKNIRSVQNAMRQEEMRQKRAMEFEEELRVAQENRDARKERFEKARRLVLQEMEEEAPLWLSSEEEVEAVLGNKDNQQKLWTRPGGFVGAPLPTQDAEFWRFETHTWDMSKNLKTPRDLLLTELEELAYENTNFDKRYWTEEKTEAQNELETKAKLRAMVREEGRLSLLMKQKRMMQDLHSSKNNAVREDGMPAIPTALPVPSLSILKNYRAMEKEGAKILHENPSKFFVFEDSEDVAATEGRGDSSDNVLGKPLRLRDNIRDKSMTGTPFPLVLGKLPKPDTRTEREKKRQEREERLWAAAQEENAGGDEIATDEEFDVGEKADYDLMINEGDDEDIKWRESLDPILDKELLETSSDKRYSEEDIEWVIEKLEKKLEQVKETIRFEQQAGLGGLNVEENDMAKALGANLLKQEGVDERGRAYTEYKVVNNDVGIDFEQYDLDALNKIEEKSSVLETLNDEQLAVIQTLDKDHLCKTADEIKAALSNVPGLSEEQVQSLVELEMTLAGTDK